jgi:hypothetical protein
LQNGLHDGRIAGATADVPGDRLSDLRFGGIWGFLQKRHRGHQEPWCAETALQGVVFMKCLLQRVEYFALSQALDGRQGGAIRLHREQ